MDPAILGAIIGAIGSVTGAVIGTIVGYTLANRKADISLFANYRVAMYYLKGIYCLYLPITVANEGNKGAAVYDLQVVLRSHNGQKWVLAWSCFSKEDPASDYLWIDGDRASPIYVHGNSATQTTIKFISVDDKLEDQSNVVFTPGLFQIDVSYREKLGAMAKTQTYSFVVNEKVRMGLEERRLDPENNGTYIFGLQEGGKGEAVA
jgi:hypothetical protein